MQENQTAIGEGDQAASILDLSAAISKYTRAQEDNDDQSGFSVDSDLILTKGRFSGQTYHTAFFQIKLTLNIKLATTYLKLEEPHPGVRMD